MTKSILLFFALLLPFHIYAQQDTTKRATTTVFFGDQSENKSDPNRYHSNNVKFGIIEIFGGQYGLFYERELNRLFSIEVGGGLTGRNFTGTLFRGLGQEEDVANQKSPNFIIANDIYDEDFKYDSRKAKIGAFVSLMPRFYYANEDGFDGNYFGLNFQYRRYNMEAFGLDPLQSSYGTSTFVDGNNTKEFEKNLILAIAWGIQSIRDHSSIDYYISVGMNKITAERRDIGFVEVPGFGGALVSVVGAKPREVSKTSLYFQMGFRIGLWWK